jgi:hypothetical protein
MFEKTAESSLKKMQRARETRKTRKSSHPHPPSRGRYGETGPVPFSTPIVLTPYPSPIRWEYVFSVAGRTPSGFGTLRLPTQGSSYLATLGWRTQSRWDCKALNAYRWERGTDPMGEGGPMGQRSAEERGTAVRREETLALIRRRGDAMAGQAPALSPRRGGAAGVHWIFGSALCSRAVLVVAAKQA